MSKFVRLTCLALVASCAVAITAHTQDKKESKKGTLPANWGKLGLSEEQKSKVYAIQGEYKDKIDDLKKQLAALQKQERTELEAVLTDGQKTRLREIVLEKTPGAGKSEKKPDGEKK